MLHIRIIAPTCDDSIETLAAIASDLRMLARPGIDLSHVQLEQGPRSVRTPEDEAMAAPGVLKKILEAEAEGIDAVIIDCTSDVALKEARAVVKIPVIGAGEAALAEVQRYGEAFCWLSAEQLADKPLEHVLKVADDVRSVIIGSTGWTTIAQELRQGLAEKALRLPVIDPLPVALEVAIQQLKKNKLTGLFS